jgi:chromosome segregation ATPase
MLSVKEASKGLGPAYTKKLKSLAKESELATARVKELEELLAKRHAEQAETQPQATAVASADPSILAQKQALAGSLDAVVAAIENDLANARQALGKAGQETRKVIDEVVARRRRIADLDRDIAKLQAERDKIAGVLAA